MLRVNHYHFENIDSTQNRARELISSYEELPLLVTAETQSAGRGRMGREWQSPPGNFYGSLALRAPVPRNQYHEYSLLMGVVLQEVIAYFVHKTATLKWPNDVLLNGQKCAGILIESDGMQNEFLIIGIGVNLIHVPQINDYTPEAIWPDESDVADRRTQFTSRLLEIFNTWHERYLMDGFEAVRSTWLQHAHALGSQITVKTPVAEMSGIFAGIDAEGSLLLTQDRREIKVTAADVRII